MQYIITHRIAGITFRTEANVSFPQLRTGKFKHFVCENVEPDVLQNIHRTVFCSRINKDPLDQDGQQLPHLPWRAKLMQVLDQVEQIEVTAEEKRALIRNFSQRQLDFFYFVDTEHGIDSEYIGTDPGFSWAPTLRQIFSAFLPFFSAALVHSSGIIRNDLTALFLAQSTGGKTTVTQIYNGDSVLSDDQIILRADENDVIHAHGTPFGRVTNGPKCARLGGLFLLEKAQAFSLEPIKPLDMLEYLWNNQLIYTYFLPTELRVKAYQMFYTACHQVPCYTMRFPKDYVDWEAIDLAMAK